LYKKHAFSLPKVFAELQVAFGLNLVDFEEKIYKQSKLIKKYIYFNIIKLINKHTLFL
jgi:hypothetical protein